MVTKEQNGYVDQWTRIEDSAITHTTSAICMDLQQTVWRKLDRHMQQNKT